MELLYVLVAIVCVASMALGSDKANGTADSDVYKSDGSYKAPTARVINDVPRNPFVVPNRLHAKDGRLYKSGSNNQWNIWKGGDDNEQLDTSDESNNKMDYVAYSSPPSFKDSLLNREQVMSLMAQMNTAQPTTTMSGLLSKFVADPLPFIIAALLPLSLILAAVLPSLLNSFMATTLPVISTIATGSTRAKSLVDESYFLPVLEAIGNFGSRAMDQPECVQKIFCQVTKGQNLTSTKPTAVQRAIYKASTFVGDSWLNTLGLKELMTSMKDGSCEKVECSKLFQWNSSSSERPVKTTTR